MTSSDSDVPGMTTHRIEALTDGIFAVAMTLLVLNLKLPQGGVEGVETDLIDLVTGQSHVFSNYAMSFLLAAVFWINHHQQSHFIKRTDRNHIWLNVIILMFVSLIPFSTSLVNDYKIGPKGISNKPESASFLVGFISQIQAYHRGVFLSS